MADRLPLIKLQPERVLEWGSFVGASRDCLMRAYPRARLIAVEPDAQRRDATTAVLAQPWWSPGRWLPGAPPALAEAEVKPGQGQLLWSNMQLHMALDPQAVMQAWCAATEVGGFLMFSTLGPGSLAGLRSLYAEAGWPTPMAPLVDMHDLGDMLMRAGFDDPVMDQQTLTLTWPTPQALLAELRGLGGNVDLGRHGALRTPRWRDELLRRLTLRADAAGRIAQVFEVVYGHAFKAAPRHAVAPETAVPLDHMRAMMTGRRGRS